MKLLAISGGVDSMVLANRYKNYKDVILAFVNYNIREDTYKDQEIVEKFAQENNIKLEILTLNNITYKNNFENWARETRYDFFRKIYDKYNCNQLILAHHKDDFIETAIMQENKNKDKLFYGIKQRTTFKGMKIYRPFLFKYWKSEIYKIAQDKKIKFHDDYTNEDKKFTRNKIRIEILSSKKMEEKEEILKYYLQKNKNNEKFVSEIKLEYKNWRGKKFDSFYFSQMKINFKEEIIKKFLNARLEKVNLNKNILKNIINFIERSQNNKRYLLTNKKYIVKKNNRIFVE